MYIRKAIPEELDLIMEKYARARSFMAEHGNPHQWGNTHPSRELIQQNIREGNLYVCEEAGRICGVFYYREGSDPTYAVIRQGAWLSDAPYGVVHHITSDGSAKGCASYCLSWALEQCGNLRIDTHQDNYVMQKLLKKNGFTYCGNICLEDGSSRLAYQKVAS